MAVQKDRCMRDLRSSQTHLVIGLLAPRILKTQSVRKAEKEHLIQQKDFFI